MDVEVLEEIGLSKNEIKSYLALLELGLTSSGPIVEKSGIPSSKIYPLLESLIEKGLVSYTQIKNIKYFKAYNPKRLYEFVNEKKEKLKEKENQLSKLIPLLEQKLILGEKLEKKDQKVQVFEGVRGIKTALENVLNILNKGNSFFVFGAPKIGNERLNSFFNDFHKRRAKKGINYKIIYDAEAKEFGEQRKKYKLTEVRYLDKGMSTPSVFWLFGDYVALVVFSGEPIALVIKNKQIVESFMTYFNFMWEKSKK